MVKTEWTLAEIKEIAEDLKADSETTAEECEGIDFLLDVMAFVEAKNLDIWSKEARTMLTHYVDSGSVVTIKPS